MEIERALPSRESPTPLDMERIQRLTRTSCAKWGGRDSLACLAAARTGEPARSQTPADFKSLAVS